MDRELIFEAEKFTLGFSRYTSAFKKETLQVINALSFKLYKGQVTAIVGASGSGKSLLAHAIMGILPKNAVTGGSMSYKGNPLTTEKIKELRGKEITLVPQGVSCLDPLMRVGDQLRKGSKSPHDRERSVKVLGRYGLNEDTERLYPFELSGGMARRVLISTAVMENPQLVIADEPTPGLHISAAKRVLSHFRELADEGSAVLLITHDLELAAEASDNIIVFYSGTAIEEARSCDFGSMDNLRHPYTRALVRAMPKGDFTAISGAQPYAGSYSGGCPFINSCNIKSGECGGLIPYIQKNNGFVRCVHG